MKLQSAIVEEGQKAGHTYKALLGEWLLRVKGKGSLDVCKVFFYDKLSVSHRHGCQQDAGRILLDECIKDGHIVGDGFEKRAILNGRLRLQTGPAASRRPCQTLSNAARQCMNAEYSRLGGIQICRTSVQAKL